MRLVAGDLRGTAGVVAPERVALLFPYQGEVKAFPLKLGSADAPPPVR